MSCNCKEKVLMPYKNNSDAWNTISLKVMRCNSGFSPALKPNEGIVVGQALFYSANEITSVYAAGLKLAGISHVAIKQADNVAGADGLGTCLPNILEPNSETLFSAYFEDGVDPSTLRVGSYYYMSAGALNEMDSTSVSATDAGSAFLLKEIIGTDTCGTKGAFVPCC